MLSTPAKGWVETVAVKYMSGMVESKKATHKQHSACDSKTNPWAQAPEMCEKTFSEI